MKTAKSYDPEVEMLWRKIASAKVASVAVVSARAGEGASTIALTLARRAASGGMSVLLVDASHGASGVARALGLSAEPGEVAMVPGMTLGVVCALSSQQAVSWREPAKLIAQVETWRAAWDVVIFDAAPVLAREMGAIPGSAVAAAAEGTVLVTLAGRTPAPVIRDAWNRLEGAGARLLGAVMNDRDNPSLLAELERETHRLARRLPGLMARLRARLHRATLLSVRV